MKCENKLDVLYIICYNKVVAKYCIKNQKRRTKKMKKITRSIITHSVSFAEVNGTNLEVFETREMTNKPGARMIQQLSKERKKQVVVISDVPIERKYSMDVDTFMKYAEVEYNEFDDEELEGE
jgi:hypothetical protein